MKFWFISNVLSFGSLVKNPTNQWAYWNLPIVLQKTYK